MIPAKNRVGVSLENTPTLTPTLENTPTLASGDPRWEALGSLLIDSGCRERFRGSGLNLGQTAGVGGGF